MKTSQKKSSELSESSYLLQILTNQVPGHWPNPEFQDPFFSFSFFSFFRQGRENHHGQLPMQISDWLKLYQKNEKKTNTKKKTKRRKERARDGEDRRDNEGRKQNLSIREK